MAFILAAFSGVIVFLPPEGRIGVPLHDAMVLLLGRATFMVPLTFVFAGILLVVRALKPATALPRGRLVGIGLLALAVLPSEYLLGSGESTGLVGHWLSAWLLDLLGGPTTLMLLVVLLGFGVFLTFDVRVLRFATPRADGASGGQWKDAAG